MAKNLISRSVFLCLAQFEPPKTFLWILPQLVAKFCSEPSSYECKRKLMNEIQENGKKKNKFWYPKLFCDFYLYQKLDIVASYHCMKFQGKLMIQTKKKKDKNPILGLVQAYWTQIWPTIFFFFFKQGWSVTTYHGQLSLCTISKKTNDPFLGKLIDRQTN